MILEPRKVVALLLATNAFSIVVIVNLLRRRKKHHHLLPPARRFRTGQKLSTDSPSRAIYLDWNATSQVFPEVAYAMLPFLFRCYGNPGSAHIFAEPCRKAVDTARCQVAALLCCAASEVVFTSSGTEADSMAILGGIEAGRAARRLSFGEKPHCIMAAIEHPAVLRPLQRLASRGQIELTTVGVSREGLVDPDAVSAAINSRTVLVTIMHSNNECGSVQPIAAISRVCRSAGVLLHTDAAQSVGKVPLCVSDLGVDMLTIVGHKFGALKGVAALYVRQGLDIPPLLDGGGQEGGKRSGTENVIGVAGMGKAAEIANNELSIISAHMSACTDLLRARLVESLGDCVRFQGPLNPTERLPNTVSVSFLGCNAYDLVHALRDVVAISAGSACHAGCPISISPVLQAMQIPEEEAVATVRISTGRHTTLEEVEQAATHITAMVKKLRLHR